MMESFIESIHWLGHDAFRIDGDRVVYFDPFQISAGPPADLILISHEHYDHCSPEDVARIATPDTIIVTEAKAAKKLTGDVRVVAPGDSLAVAGITIEAVPAYNVDKAFHPKANGWLGFIVTIENVRLYHAGDTDVIPEMANFKVDVALLPVSGTYVMTAAQAVEAAQTISPKMAIPMHYGGIVGSSDDAEAFRAALSGKIPVTVLEKE